MTQPHYIDRSAAIADIRHCIAVASQSQPDWREVWEDALKSLTDTPMEAVAWRWQEYDHPEDPWIYGETGPREHEEHANLQALALIATQPAD